ncbi:MAG: hypothetical protein AAF658_22410, partial [Myxococcota bacterium]
MSDFERRMLDLGEHLDPGWDEARVESGLASLHARQRRRQLVRVGIFASGGLVAAAALALVALRVSPDAPTRPEIAERARPNSSPAPVVGAHPPVEERFLSFADGSRAFLLTPES